MRRKFIKSLKKDYSRSDIRRDLHKVYSTRDGRLPDLSRLTKKKTHYLRNTIIFLIIILGLLAFVSWAGFAVFNQSGGGFKSVKLTIEAPEEIASGAEITYLVKYKNLEPTALRKAELSAYYPAGFIFIGSTPVAQGERQTLWQLGSLEKGGEGKIEIKGRLIGELDEEKTLNITFSYWPDNFNSQFQVDETFTVKITSSIIGLAIEGPKQLSSSQAVEYLVKYKNESAEALADVRLKALYPEGFTFANSQPTAEKRNEENRHLDDTWLIKRLDQGAEGQIKVKGQLLPNGQKELIFKVTAEMKGQNDEYFLQQEKDFTTKVLSENIIVRLIVNGSDKEATANLGETLSYSLVVQNIGDEEINDLTVTASLDSTPDNLLDWTGLQDGNKGKASGNQIVWTKKENSALAGLIGGAEAVLDWQIKVNQNALADASASGRMKIDNLAEIKIGQWGGDPPSALIGGGGGDLSVKSNLVTIRFNSDVELLAAIRYFNDDNLAVGSGPLPPKVGETTKYRVYWRLVNTRHELTDIKVTAVLPDYVSWTNKASFARGDISYNSATKEISWTLNRLPIDLKEVAGDFEIAFTPTSDHAEKIIILMPNIKLEATDQETGGKISKVIGALTTDLVNDPNAQGKGLVVD
ncbi:MAG: hypothetical protein V1684_01840 [bacterium]